MPFRIGPTELLIILGLCGVLVVGGVIGAVVAASIVKNKKNN
jgi:hypothetical protein